MYNVLCDSKGNAENVVLMKIINILFIFFM